MVWSPDPGGQQVTLWPLILPLCTPFWSSLYTEVKGLPTSEDSTSASGRLAVSFGGSG